MKPVGGYYQPKGRSVWRVWFPWHGRKIFVNKALDGSALDTQEKAEGVLCRMNQDKEHGIFNPLFWSTKGNEYRTEIERRFFSVRYERIDVCDICGDKVKVCQDHDHKTGLIRGRLCNKCNAAIGFLKEDKETILSAARYLLFWDRQPPNRPSYVQYQKDRKNEGKMKETEEPKCICGRVLIDSKCICGRTRKTEKK